MNAFGYVLVKKRKVQELESKIAGLKWCIDKMFQMNYDEIDLVRYAVAESTQNKDVEEILEAFMSATE